MERWFCLYTIVIETKDKQSHKIAFGFCLLGGVVCGGGGGRTYKDLSVIYHVIEN